MSAVAALKIPMGLFGAFKPAEWSEEEYTRSPPFSVETVSGRVFVVPRDSAAEAALDRVDSSLGLKKVKQGHVSYLVSKGHAVKALKEFDWYVRRSWRQRELAVLWALAYLGENAGWSRSGLQLGSVAEAAGATAREAVEALHGLFNSDAGVISNRVLSELALDRAMTVEALEGEMSALPIWTEEMVMSVLCTSPGGSVAELYEAVLPQGLTIGAVYRIAERLKTKGYVYPLRHYRVNERGPMREMLTADCNNCFFGYTNPDNCLQDTLRQIEDVLRRGYGMKPSTGERATLYSSVKPVPYASRTNRRVLESLRLMHEIDIMSREGRVSGMLKKIEECYGVDLPIKIPQESP